MKVRTKRYLQVCLLAVATQVFAFAQLPLLPENWIYEQTACAVGELGFFGIVDTGIALEGSGEFQRTRDCGTISYLATVAPNACSLRTIVAGSVEPASYASPSPTTPVISHLDAGHEVRLTTPVREIKLIRLMNGPFTTYRFTETRTLTTEQFLNPALRPVDIVSGHYSLDWDGARDLPAFHGEFDFEALKIQKPAVSANIFLPTAISGAVPPVIEWTGGAQVNGSLYATVNIQLNDKSPVYRVDCRLTDGASGTFTIPADVWDKVPAETKIGGYASISLTSTFPKFDFFPGGLPDGVRFHLVQASGTTVVFTP